MNWLIVRTDFRKEAYVAAQIRNMGFDAWLPAQIIVTRTGVGRRLTAKAAQQVKELPILPRRVFAACPENELQDLSGIRYCEGAERDADQRPVQIPDAQIARFKAAIDAENTAALALAQKASRKQKAKWRSLHDALLEMIEQAKSQLEVAA